MVEKIDRKQIFFMETNWCWSCKHKWKYETQEPCSKCLYSSVGPSNPPYYEKENNYV